MSNAPVGFPARQIFPDVPGLDRADRSRSGPAVGFEGIGSRLLLLMVLAVCCLPQLAVGQQLYIWDGGGGTNRNFGTGSNWSPGGIPGSMDLVGFDGTYLPESVLATFGANRTVDTLIDVNPFGTTLDLNQRQLNVNSVLAIGTSVAGDLTIIDGNVIAGTTGVSASSQLTLDLGGTLTTSELYMPGFTGLSGSNDRLDVMGGGTLNAGAILIGEDAYGSPANGTFSIRAGTTDAGPGTINSDTVSVYATNGLGGYLTVDGLGSSWRNAGDFNIDSTTLGPGNSSASALVVRNGGLIDIGGDLNLGTRDSSSRLSVLTSFAFLNVDGTINATGARSDIRVVSGSLTAAEINLEDGRLTSENLGIAPIIDVGRLRVSSDDGFVELRDTRSTFGEVELLGGENLTNDDAYAIANFFDGTQVDAEDFFVGGPVGQNERRLGLMQVLGSDVRVSDQLSLHDDSIIAIGPGGSLTATNFAISGVMEADPSNAWGVSNRLAIGGGSLQIDGGVLDVLDGNLRLETQGFGNAAIGMVNGATADVTSLTLDSVAGDQMTFEVLTGSNLASQVARLSESAGSSTSMVVADAAFWNNSGSIFVGGNQTGSGGFAQLTIGSATTAASFSSVDGGHVVVGDTLKVWENGNVTLLDQSSLTLGILDISQPGSGFEFLGGTLVADSVIGDLVQEGGVISRGDSPGVTAIDGELNQLAGSIEFDIEGLLRGSEYDALDVSGAVMLNGTVDVNLLGSYVPTVGDTFLLVDASLYGGAPTFDFSDAQLGTGLRWFTGDFLSNGSISIAVPEPTTLWACGMLGLLVGLRRKRRN